MVKRIISVVLAAAVIAGFAVVCSADKNTDDIGGKFSSHREYCYFNGVEGSNKVVLAAEAFKNNKSLGAKKQTWEGGNYLYYKEVTCYKFTSNRGYHVGYYMKNRTLILIIVLCNFFAWIWKMVTPTWLAVLRLP